MPATQRLPELAAYLDRFKSKQYGKGAGGEDSWGFVLSSAVGRCAQEMEKRMTLDQFSSRQSSSPRPDLEATFDLLRRAQEGDGNALEALLERYLPRLRVWAHNWLPYGARDLSETDDLVQEVLLSMLSRIEYFEDRGQGAFRAYLQKALKNRVRDEIRRAQRKPHMDHTLSRQEDGGVSAVERAIGRENVARYEAALERIPAQYRAAIFHRFELGFTYQELADSLGVPSADAARMLVQRGVKKLSEEMRHAGPQ